MLPVLTRPRLTDGSRGQIVAAFQLAAPLLLNKIDGPLTRLVDYEPEDLHGDGWRLIVPPCQIQASVDMATCLRARRGGIFYQMLRGRHQDRIHVRVSITPHGSGQTVLLKYEPIRIYVDMRQMLRMKES